MKQQADDSRRSLQILVALLAAIAGVLILWWFFRQPQRPDIISLYLDRLAAVGCCLLILAAATGIGLQLLRLLRVQPGDAPERLVFGVGLGLGFLSILTLALGLIGFLSIGLWSILFVIGIAIGAKEIHRLCRDLGTGIAQSFRRPNLATVIWVIIAIFFAMNLTPAFVPVSEYDMQEYHLGVPAQFFRAGKIFNVSDNVYAAFPENVENLYLLNMIVNDSARGGAESAIILNVILTLLAAVGVRSLGKRLFAVPSPPNGESTATAGDYAAAIFYLWPAVITQLSSAYVEAGLIFYSIAAVLAVTHALSNRTSPERRGERYAWALLAGLMTGLAVGVKYQAAAFLFVPLGLLLLGDLIVCGDRRAKLIVLIAWSVGVFVAWGPWLIRDAVWYGNPVYPLLYSVFGGHGWDAVKDAKWAHAHGPGEMSLAVFGQSVKETLISWKDMSPLFFIFIPFVVLCARKAAAAVLLLLGYCALFLILWFAFTQRIERFAEPLMPFLAVLSGAGAFYLRGMLPRVLPIIFILLLIFEPTRFICYLSAAQSFSDSITSDEEYFKKTDFRDVYPAMQLINNSLPANARILFIGEARTFYCDRPFVAPTVFNDQPIEKAVAEAKDADAVYRVLHEQGFTHILLNMQELIRLQDPTKAYGYKLNGKEHLGILDGFDWDRFGAFMDRHAKPLLISGGKQTNSWPDYNFYRWETLREKGKRPGLFVGLYEVVP